MRRTNLAILGLLLGGFTPRYAVAQVEVIRGVDRVIQATQARETRAEKGREISREQEALERETRERLEANQRHPEGIVRERYSEDARLSNNPWAREARRKKELRVELFTAEQCENCARMESYLNEVGVPYRRHFLEQGSEAEQMYLSQVGRGVIPVVRINGRLVRGFEPETVRKVILEEKQHLEKVED